MTRRHGVRTNGARGRLLGLALVMALGLTTAAAAERTVGVAAFERVAARGQVVPDVSTRLAQRLGTRGLDKVAGPTELGAPASSKPEAADVSSWAKQAGVGAVVVGRTTRLGRSLSVDARVYDGAGSMLGAPLVEEVTRVEDLPRAIEALADQVIERIGDGTQLAAVAPSARPAARSASPDVAAASPPSAAPAPKKSGRYDDKSPISIKADNLESQSNGDRRKFLFTGNVRAVQDDLVVTSRRMEAFYPPGSSSPDRMVATGNVKLVQTDRVAYCRKAVFFRKDQRVVCTGDLAELEQDCDRVRGEKITFHLDTEVMHVSGAADVSLRPEDPSCSGSTTAAAPGGAGR